MTEKKFKSLSKTEQSSHLDSLWNKMFDAKTAIEKRIAENTYYKFRNIYYKEIVG